MVIHICILLCICFFFFFKVTSVLDSTVDSWATSYVSIVSGNTNSVLFASLMMLVSCEYKTPPIDNSHESHVLLNREKDPLCH